MCGIVGAIGAKIDGSFLANMFLATEPRGVEATGFWFPSTGVQKDALKVSDFLPVYKEEFDAGVEKDNVFIGHCRLATHGEPAYNENNHPIESENWRIVHNGIVSMKDLIDYPYVSDTDTENILAYVEKYGIETGLTYCTSGAAIIMVPKDRDDTLYLWKTATADMLIAYDMDNETFYICSGEKYMKEALDPLSEKPERLGGLFSIADRRIKITEPKARELWKVTLVDGKIHSNMEKSVSAVYSSNNGYGGHTRHACGYATGYRSTWEEDKVKDGFCPLGTGNNRPSVLDGTIKSAALIQQEAEALREAREKARTSSAATASQQKADADNGNGVTSQSVKKGTPCERTVFGIGELYTGDFVQLSREPLATDPIYASNGGVTGDLKKGDIMIVKKRLQHARYAIEDTLGNLFTVPRSLIELAENPNCFAVGYMSLSTKCLHKCWWRFECKSIVDEYIDEDLPQCAGTFEANDDDCTNCWYVAPCLKIVATRREQRLQSLEDLAENETITVEAEEIETTSEVEDDS
ncbi:MAG: class II glutamine amidotransferase [Candidatus Thorarchaeota archaeon]|jgi:hypothetical protein